MDKKRENEKEEMNFSNEMEKYGRVIEMINQTMFKMMWS